MMCTATRLGGVETLPSSSARRPAAMGLDPEPPKGGGVFVVAVNAGSMEVADV
ncbi:hypothetical protein GGC64_006259 [Mycobacterium sp. OAS707]|nr:hypothetical protein [Mycobacterium sp. OAS707]